jgi:hypothetical protein
LTAQLGEFIRIVIRSSRITWWEAVAIVGNENDTLLLVHPLKKLPVVAKVRRAQSVIVHGKHLFLKECKKCGGDFYGGEKQTRCGECAGRKGKRAS